MAADIVPFDSHLTMVYFSGLKARQILHLARKLDHNALVK